MAAAPPLQPLERASLLLLAPFALALLAAVARRPSIFVRRHGRAHRLLGGAHLAWLALGLADVAAFAPHRRVARLAHDVGLGALGTALTLAAAAAFDEKRGPRKFASGALDESAVVSRDEMLEHAFYQLLNLVQVLYLHALPACGAQMPARLALCLMATSPWLVRAAFPVHSFSANYATSGRREAMLYRLKKWQYVAYKHALLHGLNLSAALATAEHGNSLPQQRFFRLYWQCLNAAYVLEFFMQTRARPASRARRSSSSPAFVARTHAPLDAFASLSSCAPKDAAPKPHAGHEQHADGCLLMRCFACSEHRTTRARARQPGAQLCASRA